MGTRGTGRRRSMKTERTTAEEEALNLITAQAEAKLAAKRAARAEAREIRLQELERQQREVRNEDCCDEGSGASSVSSPPPAGTSCQLGAGCTCTGNGSSSLNNEVMLAEVQEKYRKAMVSIAQLDNEKNELMYVVDVLKDSLLELEELLSESRREYEDKVKEHEQEKHAHCNLMHQFREMKETLKQDQEQLNELHNKQAALVQNISDLHHTLEWKDKRIQVLEQQREFAEDSRLECTELREVQELKDASMNHGRMLKPSFCVNGATGASAVVDSANADNGVFGSPAETELKSREEDLDPQHQKQEPGEHPRSSEPLQEHVETSALPEEPYCSAESSLSVDMTVASETIPAEDGDAPQTQDQSTVNAAHIQKKETGKIIQEEQEAKSSSVQHHDSMPRPEINVEEDLQPLPTEPSCEALQNAAELESGDKMEDKANKSQSATTSGKKKKKKRGKRKGSSHDNKNREETKSENETRANKKLKEEADIKDVNNKLKAEDAKESGTIDVSVMLRFPEKTLQESNIRSASGKTEKPTEQEGETAELLKDDKCDNKKKTEGTLHPKKAKPENAATLADGSFQIGVLEEPKTDSMFVDREDNQNPETEIVNIDEAGVRTEEEASSCPDRDETSSSDISGPILQKSSHSEGLGLIRISGAEACSVLSSKDDAAETPSSSESRPTEICSGVSGSEKPFGGVVELNPGGCEAEYGGDNIPHCATSPSHDEDSELTGRPQEQKMTEDMGRDGDWSELDPPTQSEDICASSDLLGPNGTCQNMGEEPTAADTLEVEGKFVTSDPKLEKDQNNLESESSSFHLDESRTCGGGPEEEEEQSFEFDDTDLELAAVRSPSKDPEWREAMKGTSADTGAHKSCQSPSEEELGQNNLYKSEQFTDAEIQEKKNSSLSCEAAPERLENTNQTYESMEVSEAHAENPKELRGSADSEGQTKFSAAKTDIDPVRQKDFPNLCEQTGGSNEGKDAKKSSRKGKGKSKEECKMS